MQKFLLSVTVIGALVLAVGAVAASAATGYSFFGDAQLVSPGEASAHAAQATSKGTNGYGGVDFAVPAGLTVSGLSTLSTDSMFTVGSCGAGSPRFSVTVSNGTNTGNLFFYLGSPPNYTACAPDVWTGSGNLADASNLVDATQLGGGFYEPYSAVQADYGTYAVSGISLVVDGTNQTTRFDNTQVNSTTYTYDPTCTQTGFFRDGINMTAAQIGGNVTGNLDAAGCNIGVYYSNTTTSGNVTGANISGANYFGVVVNGDVGTVKTNVTGSTIHDIGETPLNGTQHGTAIYYRAFGGTASGTISGNTLTNYQKGGIAVNGNVTATITNNTVTGQGPVNYIAQNGIQVGYGAKATVTGNTVTGNAYTGTNLASSAGILVVGGECFGPGLAYTVGLDISKNTLTGNDVGVWLFNANASCNAPTTKTNNSVKFNTISNGVVTNTTGDSATCGYQAGVSDLGKSDLIVNNTISGFGYTPTAGGDCTAPHPAFLRFIDAGSSAHGVSSNK
jgi:parallel beta-helix repeat protein